MNLKSKKVLVTGGAGFIGSHLVDALTGPLVQANVRVIDDFSTGSYANLAHHDRRQVEVIEGDICNRELLDEVIRDVDVIFHLACRGVRHSIGNPIASHHVNAEGTLELLRVAHQHGVERFIHMSTSEVYGTTRRAPMDEDHPCNPETVYGAAKLAGEAYARAYHRTYGLPTVVVRPFNNFGPRSHFEGDSGEVIPRFCVWALNNRQPAIFGDGNQTRDFIYVQDTAYWLCKIAESDQAVGQTINLGSGVEHSVNELAEVVYELAGCPQIKPSYLDPRPGDVRRLVADSRLANDLLGFEPRIGLRDGIANLLTSLKESQLPPSELLNAIMERNWHSLENNTTTSVH